MLNRRAVGALGVDLKYRADRDYDRTVKFMGIVASNVAQAIKIQRRSCRKCMRPSSVDALRMEEWRNECP